MTTYRFAEVLVWDVGPGGVLKLLRNGSVTVKNADTDAAIMTVMSDQNGRVTFTTTDVPAVYLVSPAGLVSELIPSPDAFAEASGAAASAAASAQAAEDAVRAGSGVSGMSLDTDGVPYFDQTGTVVFTLDTDGVPYIY